MSNTQLYLAYIIPTVLVLVGILLNRSDNQALRTEMVTLRKDLTADMLTLRKDLIADMVTLRKDLNADMVSLRNQIHTDVIGPHERVAVVEAKQS